MYVFFHLQVVEIPGVKSKVKNRLVEWLRERVVRGSQKALAIKNGTVSLLLLLLLIVNDYCKKNISLQHLLRTTSTNSAHLKQQMSRKIHFVAHRPMSLCCEVISSFVIFGRGHSQFGKP